LVKTPPAAKIGARSISSWYPFREGFNFEIMEAGFGNMYRSTCDWINTHIDLSFFNGLRGTTACQNSEGTEWLA
jgi:hypothetical protein